MKSLPHIALASLLMAAPSLQARTYYYDDAGRLTQVAYAGGQGLRYTYDDADNLTSEMPIAIPKAATDLIVTRASLTTARLQWQDNASTESGYLVQRRLITNNDWRTVATLVANATSHTDEALSPEANYVYRIVAQGAAGDSAYSNAATAAGEGSESFVITLFDLVTEDRLRVSFTTEEAATYVVENSPDLSLGSWRTIPFASTPTGNVTQNAVTGNGSDCSVFIEIPADLDRAFYRIKRMN